MNRLQFSNSPYLLQHAHNPVDWFPWGEEALLKSKQENKLIIVSIGYAACHWCHVMEKESFEEIEVAQEMNLNFISIKVDREERPDIDQVYMESIMVMSGHGGWPLNIICLPDGRPVWGGTYFPKHNWIQALKQLAEIWNKDPEKMHEYASRLMDGIAEMEQLELRTSRKDFPTADLESALLQFVSGFDPIHGGANKSPKFPMPNNLLLLLRQAFFSKENEHEKAVFLTLKKMAMGGIYDPIGGGFCRYSTDRFWKVPHFEKMLYDNAQLISLYSEAWRYNPNPLYKSIVEGCIAFVQNELKDEEGGFFSSLDADSEGEEGKFYTWSKIEIQNILGDDASWYCEFYNVTENGNWEGNNILIQTEESEIFAKKIGMSPENFEIRLKELNQILRAEREKRIRPALDDKILCAWNALMISGLCEAYKSFGNSAFLSLAESAVQFIFNKMKRGEGIFRSYRNGKASISGFLDDYALLISAFLDLYEVSGNLKWLGEAKILLLYCENNFSSNDNSLFYYTSKQDEALIFRKIEVQDNVMPSSNSVMALNYFRMGKLLSREDWLSKAKTMLLLLTESFLRFPGAYSNWGLLFQKFAYPFFECVITGPHASQFSNDLFRSAYYPNRVQLWAEKSEIDLPDLFLDRFSPLKTSIFICKDNVCRLPVLKLEEAYNSFLI